MTAGRKRGRPIAAAIVALVVGAVLASTIVLFVVTFSGPPPMQMPIRIDEVAARLTGAQLPAPDRPPFHRPEGFSRLFGPDRPRLILSRTPTSPRPTATSARLPEIEARLAALIGTPVDRIVAISDRQPPFLRHDITGDFSIGWRVDGGWRIVRPGPRPLLTRWHKATLLAMLIAIVALAIPAWIIARAIARPLRQLAGAAEQARGGACRPDFPIDGPAEVRALTSAVAAMHDRLTGHAEARTAMLAAIAHDLGTPLARLSFWIEQLPDPARDRAIADIDEMRAMIRDTLAFARDDAGERDVALVDMPSLLDALVEDMRVGGSAVTIAPGPRAVVRGDPRSLRRAIANLIGNALRYGDRAAVSWRVDDDAVTIAVADEGPGVDPAQAERLFEPFVRGEASRNRATGGTGLGLAMVRSIAARHGGSVRLDNRSDGHGAVARLHLPLAR